MRKLLFFVILIKNLFSLSPNEICIWQHLDSKGYVLPYFTTTFLEELKKWDIKNWEIFEWGAGFSTVWFVLNCKSLVTIEENANLLKQTHDYLNKIDPRFLNQGKVVLKLRQIEQKRYLHPILGEVFYNVKFGNIGYESEYVNSINEDYKKYDCIIIAGAHRIACAKQALKHVKSNGIIIVNNMNQATVGFDASEIYVLYNNFKHYSFKEPSHLDWCTDYWVIKESEKK